MSNDSQMKPITLGNAWMIVLSMIQMIGLYLSDQLTMEHIGLKLGDKTDSGLCGASELFSCKAAAASSYSQIGSLPIAVIGEAYYLCALLMIILVRVLPIRFKSDIWLTLGLTSILGALYALFLGTVSLFDLGFLCPLCMGLYAVNFGALALLWWQNSVKIKSIPQLLKTPSPWLMLVLMILSLVGAQSLYATRFESEYKIAKHRLKQKEKPTFKEVEVGLSPIKGDSSAAVVIEFSDFQCPYCRRFTQYLKKAFDQSHVDYPFSVAFKHFPLSSQCNPHIKRDMHPRACYAAMASICAQEQGQFWAMHDILFEHQHELADQDLKNYAQTLNLNIPNFIECLSSEKAKKRLNDDIKLGAEVGIRGTPAFFVNGWGFKGAKKPQAIREAVAEYAYGIKPQPKESEPKKPAPPKN